MMTADEKNHVITNANDELDHQLYRLDSIYPYISGEVSDEARLGSLTHWAYSNRTNVKATTTNERPRREAATATSHLVQALHEAEAASRSEARREAVMARKQRRNQAESDFDETRNGAARKGTVAKARAAAAEPADASVTGGAVPTKRRKVEKPTPVQIGSAAMERSVSSVTNTGRTVSKDGTGNEAKKRARAPNALATAGRKRYSPSHGGRESYNNSMSLQKQYGHFKCRIALGCLISTGRNFQSSQGCLQSGPQWSQPTTALESSAIHGPSQRSSETPIVSVQPWQ
jgi:hypothetical protein